MPRQLTVDLGLRWELYPNRWRSGGMGIESYDPTTNEALIGGKGDMPQDNGVGYSKTLFAPRLGLAYRIGDNASSGLATASPTTRIRGARRRCAGGIR